MYAVDSPIVSPDEMIFDKNNSMFPYDMDINAINDINNTLDNIIDINYKDLPSLSVSGSAEIDAKQFQSLFLSPHGAPSYVVTPKVQGHQGIVFQTPSIHTNNVKQPIHFTSTVQQVCQYMAELNINGYVFSELVLSFEDEYIDGKTFLNLKKSDLNHLGCYEFSKRNALYHHIQQLKSMVDIMDDCNNTNTSTTTTNTDTNITNIATITDSQINNSNNSNQQETTTTKGSVPSNDHHCNTKSSNTQSVNDNCKINHKPNNEARLSSPSSSLSSMQTNTKHLFSPQTEEKRVATTAATTAAAKITVPTQQPTWTQRPKTAAAASTTLKVINTTTNVQQTDNANNRNQSVDQTTSKRKRNRNNKKNNKRKSKSKSRVLTMNNNPTNNGSAHNNNSAGFQSTASISTDTYSNNVGARGRQTTQLLKRQPNLNQINNNNNNINDDANQFFQTRLELETKKYSDPITNEQFVSFPAIFRAMHEETQEAEILISRENVGQINQMAINSGATNNTLHTQPQNTSYFLTSDIRIEQRYSGHGVMIHNMYEEPEATSTSCNTFSTQNIQPQAPIMLPPFALVRIITNLSTMNIVHIEPMRVCGYVRNVEHSRNPNKFDSVWVESVLSIKATEYHHYTDKRDPRTYKLQDIISFHLNTYETQCYDNYMHGVHNGNTNNDKIRSKNNKKPLRYAYAKDQYSTSCLVNDAKSHSTRFAKFDKVQFNMKLAQVTDKKSSSKTRNVFVQAWGVIRM